MIFTESAPLGRFSHRVAMSVRVSVVVCHRVQFLLDPRGAGLHLAFQFSYVGSFACLLVRPSLRSNIGPYTFIKGQRDNTGTKGQYRNKGTTKGQQTDNKGPKEQRDKGTKEHRKKGTKEQRNNGTEEQRNTGTKEHGNTETKEHGNKGNTKTDETQKLTKHKN